MQLVWTRTLTAPYSTGAGATVASDGTFWLAGAIRGPATVAAADGTTVDVSARQQAYFARIDLDGAMGHMETSTPLPSEGWMAEAVRVDVTAEDRVALLVRGARVDAITGDLERTESRLVLHPPEPTPSPGLEGAPLLALDATSAPGGVRVLLLHVEATERAELGELSLEPPGTAVVVGVHADGAVAWARRFGRSEASQAVAVAVSADGSVTVASFEPTPERVERLRLTRFVAGDGPLQSVLVDASADTRPTCILALDPSDVVVGGRRSRNEGTATEEGIPELSGSGEAFLLRLGEDFSVLWELRFEGTGPSAVTALARGGDGWIYVAGHFAGSMTAGGVALESPSITTFLAKITDGGVLLELLAFGSDTPSDVSVPRALAASPSGCLVVGTRAVFEGDLVREEAQWSLVGP